MITIKSQKEIDLMRHAGKIVAGAHALVGKMIKPGVTTQELDHAVEQYIREADAIPTFKGYGGFPNSICASINEVVVHGIPEKRRLQDGDIISIDIGATYQGYVGDAAVTHGVGTISDEAEKLIRITRESFIKALPMPGRAIACLIFPMLFRNMLKKMAFRLSATMSDTALANRCTKIHRYLIMGQRDVVPDCDRA